MTGIGGDRRIGCGFVIDMYLFSKFFLGINFVLGIGDVKINRVFIFVFKGFGEGGYM